ncbi:MAG TPA: phytanoyl-CoA dioxygenase family protein [Gammaproteobacteria bacterium]|jgi:ectoine hydroxylase-related dioxygenase (phytanoyl-CoA dioxygenase family)|nr:MAG: phytanoyl-CoA dioxygenase family protein [Proteobacteria bacterium TMED51]HAU41194.1 phytanoyl-CoA dioxygenase family protein [Gammaproteobacteria bacterium]HCL93143.1 phytanoyl-CoA dioxygenase family protein [Gammaproteobacteria bacterium]|tara:strand:+ start:42 stop:863 length:822 start_codon:yes stop_codon:yes gene_type:complete
MLTDEELARYYKLGFVVPDYRLSETTLTRIRAAHCQFIERYPAFSDYCPALIPLDPCFLEFARDETILNMVGQVLGNNFALWNSSFFAKPAQVGTRTPWHQDGEYWAMRPLATCTVWMAIDDATPENGCLRFIPGSHLGKQVRKHRINNAPGLALNQELTQDQFQESEAVDLVLEAGQMSLHDVYLVHGSEPNRSDHSRRGMTLRFMPTSSYYDREIEQKQNASSPYPSLNEQELRNLQRVPLYLMRGTDLCARNRYAGSFSGENDFRRDDET